MKRRLIFLLFVFVAFQCTTGSSNEENQVSEPASKPYNLTNANSISKYLQVTISEYDQYKSLFETTIHADTITKIEKNIKTGLIEKIILEISVPGILAKLEPYIERNLPRSYEYYEPRSAKTKFVHIETMTLDSMVVNVSFRNSRTHGLDTILNIVNSYLPASESIISYGTYVEDKYVSPNELSTWDQLINVAHFDSKEFDIDNIDKTNYVRIDSTVFGKHIIESLYLKSVYILAVSEKIGTYYPCFLYQEQYESDDVFTSISLVMLDSALEKEVNQLTISAAWQDFAMNFVSIAKVDSNQVVLSKWEKYECDELESDFEQLTYKESYQVTELGEIELVKIDTLEKKYCR